MTTPPRYARITAPLWWALDAMRREDDSNVLMNDDDGRAVLVSGFEAAADAPYVGCVHAGSVLPVALWDENARTVDLQIPAPWNWIHEDLPLDDPDVLVIVDAQDEPPHIEELVKAAALEMFPELRRMTQDDLDTWGDD